MAKNKSESKFLLDSSPMLFYPEVAKILGTNEAIFIQQLNYWIQQNQLSREHWKEGRIWVYNTLKEWQEYNFIMWSESTITRILKGLTDKKIVIKKKFNYSKSDQTLWYTIDYDVLDSFLLECEKPENQRKKYKNPMDTENADKNSHSQNDKMSNTNGSDDFNRFSNKGENSYCGKPVDKDVDNKKQVKQIVRKQSLKRWCDSFGQNDKMHLVKLTKSILSKWRNLHITENTITQTTYTERSKNVSSETPLSVSDIWNKIKENLITNEKCKMTDISFKTWIEPIQAIGIKNNVIILKTNMVQIKQAIEFKYKIPLLNATRVAGIENFLIIM